MQQVSLKALTKEFFESLRPAFKELESQLCSEIGTKATFSFLVFERNSLIYQIRVSNGFPVTMELWSVRDNPQKQQIDIKCKTLYELKLKKHNNSEFLERHSTLPYANLWMHFGVHI